jgi:hypothetical protein
VIPARSGDSVETKSTARPARSQVLTFMVDLLRNRWPASWRFPMSDSHASVSLPRAHVVVDATGLLCPGPIVELAKAIKGAEIGHIVEVVATDSGFLVRRPSMGSANEARPHWRSLRGRPPIASGSERSIPDVGSLGPQFSGLADTQVSVAGSYVAVD